MTDQTTDIEIQNIIKLRRDICLACPYSTNFGSIENTKKLNSSLMCTVCGCIIQTKTALLSTECPLPKCHENIDSQDCCKWRAVK